MSPNKGKQAPAKSYLEQLRTDRRTQIAVVVFPLVLVGMGWYLLQDDAPKRKPGARARTTASSSLPEAQLKRLQGLPNLVALDRAGQLPDSDRTYRDPFTFELPPPPPAKPAPPPPPPPPPSEAELAARRAREQRQQEEASKPATLRYLGYFEGRSKTRIGAFMKGEDAVQFKVGDLVAPRWKLKDIGRERVLFQNLTYTDMTFELRAVDQQEGISRGTTTNNY